MIRETDSFEIGALQSPFRPGPVVPARTAAPVDPETAEKEIARLTWSVLDGSASLTDRQRLAELVNAQHAVRLPPPRGEGWGGG